MPTFVADGTSFEEAGGASGPTLLSCAEVEVVAEGAAAAGAAAEGGFV